MNKLYGGAHAVSIGLRRVGENDPRNAYGGRFTAFLIARRVLMQAPNAKAGAAFRVKSAVALRGLGNFGTALQHRSRIAWRGVTRRIARGATLHFRHDIQPNGNRKNRGNDQRMALARAPAATYTRAAESWLSRH